ASCRHFCCLDDTPTVAFAWSRDQPIHVAGHTSIQLSRSADVIHCLDAIGVTGSLRRLYAPDVVRGTPAPASGDGQPACWAQDRRRHDQRDADVSAATWRRCFHFIRPRSQRARQIPLTTARAAATGPALLRLPNNCVAEATINPNRRGTIDNPMPVFH